MSTPFVDVIGNMGSYGLAESGEELQSSVMSDRELNEWNEIFGDRFKGGVSPYYFINVPLGDNSHKGSLKYVYLNWILNSDIWGMPKVEGQDMVGVVFP